MHKFAPIFLLAYLPFSPLIKHFIPFKVYGFTFWETIFPFAFLITLFLTKKYFSRKFDLFLLGSLLLLVIFVITLRSEILYEDSHSLIESWFLFFPIFIVVLLKRHNPNNNSIAKWILLIQIFFNGITGWLYLFGLPTIHFPSDSWVISGRFEGIFGNANVYAITAFTYFLVYNLLNKNKILIGITSIITFGGMIASGSRGPLFLFIISTTYFLISSLKGMPIKRKLYRILGYSILLYGIFLLYKDFSPININDTRLIVKGFSDQSRIDKTNLAINGLFSSNENLFLGLKVNQQYSNGIVISDNSFTLISSAYGLIILLYWILVITYFLKYQSSPKINTRMLFFTICILATFSTTNAILFMPWVYVSIFGYYILKNENIQIT